MLHTKFQGHRPIASEVEDFLRFFPYELWFQIAQLFLRKTSFNFEIWVTFDQGQRMTLTFDTHPTS